MMNKVFLFTKNLKTKKKTKNLTISSLNYFLFKFTKKKLVIISNYIKILKYILYFIY